MKLATPSKRTAVLWVVPRYCWQGASANSNPKDGITKPETEEWLQDWRQPVRQQAEDQPSSPHKTQAELFP